MTEGKFVSQAMKWLRSQGAYVIKTRPGFGIPAGCCDVFVFYGPNHADIEFKASPKAPYRAGQEATLAYLRRSGTGNPFVYTAYPENWEEIKAELLQNFFQSAYGR